MDFVALECSSVRVDTGELNVLAEVVPAIVTEEAVVAGNTRLNGDAIACYPLVLCSSFVLIWAVPGCRCVTPSPHFRTTPAAS